MDERRRAPELIAAVAIVLVAGLLRFWAPGSVGIEHYDEGVYVISAFDLSEPGMGHRLYPDQMFFSPPLYVALVALAHAMVGGSLDRVAVLVSALFGTLTVGLLWWIGRSWFGSAAGLAAAAMLALSDFHIALSRAALTDVTFAFFLLAAVALIVGAFDRDSLLLAALAGLCTGLAWNTKYHGWLAVALGLVAWAGFVLWRRQPVGWRRAAAAWGIIGGIALVSYLPWAVWVQRQPGGYAALTAWQGAFLDFRWSANLLRHAREQIFLDGRLTDVSVMIAAGLAFVAMPGRRPGYRTASILGAIALLSWLAGGWVAMLAAGAAGAVALAARPDHLSSWLAGAWLVVFAALTPLYFPYARLFLPITVIGCLLSGLALSVLAASGQARPSGARAAASGCIAVAIVVGLLPRPSGPARDPLRPARGAAEAASLMSHLIPLGSRVKVIEEPPVAWYLYGLGFDTLRDVQDKVIPAGETEPVYVVTGFYGDAGLERLGGRVRLLGRFPFRPKDLRLLDDLRPPFPEDAVVAEPGRHDLMLYELAPAVP